MNGITPQTITGTPPGQRGHWLLGNLGALQRNPLHLFKEVAQLDTVARFRVGPQWAYILSHPRPIKHVLQDNNRNYIKDPLSMNLVKLFTSENLFTAEGDFWLRQRRIMQPAFHHQQLASFGQIISDCTQEMIQRWRRAAADDLPLRIDREMMQVTLKIVGLTLFSTDLTDQSSELGHAFATSNAYFIYRALNPLTLPIGFPTRRNRAAQNAAKTIQRTMLAIIQARRESPARHDDLLTLLMETPDKETGEVMSDEQLRRELTSMIFAGHETTANTLTWACYLLSQHAAVAEKLFAEVNSGLVSCPPTTADLPNLTYTRQIIDETLRLYPPAWGFGRQAIAADTIDGYRIPAKSNVIISPYVMHHHPHWWDEPARFEPERFEPGQTSERPRFAYLPFGGGPRLCIGQQFALMEATLILAAVAQQIQLHLLPGYSVQMEPLLTLGIKGGLPMKISQTLKANQ
jgi:cytochrome P450